jgi:hypothetical protein
MRRGSAPAEPKAQVVSLPATWFRGDQSSLSSHRAEHRANAVETGCTDVRNLAESAGQRAVSSGRRDSNPRSPPWQGPSKRPRTSASVHLRKWVRVRAWSRSAAGRGDPARTKQHRARNRARTEKSVVSERASVDHGEPPRGDLEHPPVNPPRKGLEPRAPRRRTIRP